MTSKKIRTGNKKPRLNYFEQWPDQIEELKKLTYMGCPLFDENGYMRKISQNSKEVRKAEQARAEARKGRPKAKVPPSALPGGA